VALTVCAGLAKVSILTSILGHQQETKQRLNKLVLGVIQLSQNHPLPTDLVCYRPEKKKSICSQAHENPTKIKALQKCPPSRPRVNQKIPKQNSML
jgi:hypothetical protein